MRFLIGALPLVLAAPAAWAFECSFSTECFETESCRDSAFWAEIRLEDEAISTEFGDLTIVVSKTDRDLAVIFATGGATEFLLTVTPGGARMTAHINQGPQSITYLGQCAGAF